jgi:tRNA(Ile)-lysidine synthase
MGQDPVSAEISARLSRAIPAGSTICVGFSGGLDSTVLLDLLGEHAAAAGHRVTALHVHHGLSPNADQWVKFCERFCANQGIALTVEHVRVDVGSSLGLEGAARAARYAVYAARPEPYVALAHHLDDQAETVLMQLLRGTGLKGIAAMPELRSLRGTGVQIFRPLLGHSRAALHAYAQERGLRWIEDESNAATRHDRNFLRHDIGPLLDERYPGWREAIARFARHAGAASELLDELATLDGAPARAGEALPLDAALSDERRANALRAFLARNAVAMPSEARLEEMARQLFEAREDARVRIDHAGVSIVRHRNTALIDRHLEPAATGPGRAGWRVDWHQESDVELGANRGTVHFDAVVGEGIAIEPTREGEWFLASRTGGETIRLGADRPTRTLKNLLQEREIPMWQREDFPLLFHGGRLVWIPGVGIAAEYACKGGEPGLQPSWRVAGKTPLC